MASEIKAQGTIHIVYEHNNTGLILVQQELHRLVNIGRYRLGYSETGRKLIPVQQTKFIDMIRWLTAYDALPYNQNFVCIPVAVHKLQKYNFDPGDYTAVVWHDLIVF